MDPAVAAAGDRVTVSSQATDGARRAVGTHHGPTQIHLADYSLRHRRDGNAGTTILLSSPQLPPPALVLRDDCGPPGAGGGWAPPSHRPGPQDLPRDYGPGRSSERTKPEYTASAASGRRDHATFGSGPTRQSDERDSEPDYLLRPTRHGPGGTLLIITHSF